jgi:hypothetical protein
MNQSPAAAPKPAVDVQYGRACLGLPRRGGAARHEHPAAHTTTGRILDRRPT